MAGAYDSFHIGSNGEYKTLLKAATFAIGLLRATPIDYGSSAKQGSIALYEIATSKFGLITNHQMIPHIDIEFVCSCYISFEGFGRLILRPSDIEKVTTNEELDATVIELTESCVSALRERGAHFLIISTAHVGEEVFIVKSPYAFFSAERGIVQSLRGSGISYSSQEGIGSSGSPIFYSDLQAIGLHRHMNNEALYNCDEFRSATLIQDIVAFHLTTRESFPE